MNPGQARRPISAVGLIGLETAHAAAWQEALAERGVVTVLCAETEKDWPQAFAVASRVPGARIVRSKEELASAIDAVAMVGCDWDRRVDLAEFFAPRNVALFVDKPVAGNDLDLTRIASLPHRSVFGSCNRYHQTLLEWRGRADIEALEVETSQPPTFYYTIHAVEVGQTVIGRGARRVRSHIEGFEVEQIDGRRWTVKTGEPGGGLRVRAWSKKHVGEDLQFRPGGQLQKALVSEFLRVADGGTPIISADEAVEAVQVLRSAYTSEADGGRWVDCTETGLKTFSAAEFARNFRARNRRADREAH